MADSRYGKQAGTLKVFAKAKNHTTHATYCNDQRITKYGGHKSLDVKDISHLVVMTNEIKWNCQTLDWIFCLSSSQHTFVCRYPEMNMKCQLLLFNVKPFQGMFVT